MLEVLNWVFWSPLYLFQLAFPLIFWAVIGVTLYDCIKEQRLPNLRVWEWRWFRRDKSRNDPEDYIGL
jgi:hypothetical protein